MKWLGPTWLTVNLNNIYDNLKQIRRITNAKICAVIKGDAYGHGITALSLFLCNFNLPYLAVSDLSEALQVRAVQVKTPILVLNPILPEEVEKIVEENLTPSVTSRQLVTSLARHAFAKQKQIKIHIKLETGLNRVGVSAEEAIGLAKLISKYEYLKFEGVYSHFSAANEDIKYTKKQLNRLLELKKTLVNMGFQDLMWHCANSAALVNLPASHLNMVRIGTMLFGQSIVRLPKTIHLVPTWQLYTRIIRVKPVKKGEYIGYNKSFLTKKDTQIGVIPLGYGDGLGLTPNQNSFWGSFRLTLRRLVPSSSCVYLDGVGYPIIGKLAMGMCCIDLSAHPEPETLYGAIVQVPTRRTTISRRIPKIYKKDGKIMLIDWHNKLWQPFTKNEQIYLKETSTFIAKECLKWRN